MLDWVSFLTEQAATGAEGVNIITNNGAAAGQVVFHLHIHVIPRFGEDGLIKLPGPYAGMIAAEEARQVLQEIQSSL